MLSPATVRLGKRTLAKLVQSCKQVLVSTLSNNTWQTLNQAGVSTHLLKYHCGLRHHIDNVGPLKTEASANSSGKEIDTEESVLLEGLREHSDVFKIHDADTFGRDVDQKVVLANVGMVYGKAIWQRDRQ